MPFIRLYLAQLPETEFLGQVIPNERNEEIKSCLNEKTRREKVFVWKLLERALQDFYSPPNMAVLTKDVNGKWGGLDLQFSLSHSKDVLAVAISDSAVGVDVQVERPLKNSHVLKKVFSEFEMSGFSKFNDARKTSEIIKLWTKKESMFKMLGESNFLSVAKSLDVTNVHTFDFELGVDKYHLSVSGNGEIETITVKI